MKRESPSDRVEEAPQTGLFAMMAMMVVCCAGIVLLLAIIPFIGWPAGAVVAIGLGAGLMYVHMKFMRHGGHH